MDVSEQFDILLTCVMQVKCTECQFCSNKYEPFLDLSLQIVKAESLRKALSSFTAAEKLDDGKKEYRCERCKQKVQALKQLTIDKPPHVLTIHLKRFGAHPGHKIDRKVEFEPFLDLKSFVSDPNVSYQLSLMPALFLVLSVVAQFFDPLLSFTGWKSEIHSVRCAGACWLEHTFRSLLLLCSYI